MSVPVPTVAITGSSGFVGRYLVSWLAGRGWSVRPVTLRSAASVAEARPATRESVTAALAGAQAVVHLAARVHVMDEAAAEGAQHYTDANVGLTRLLLEAAGHAGVSTLVFASSVKAVGESNQIPWTEATPPRPVDPYGASKLAAESLLAEASRGGSLRTVSLRFPLLYGPGMRGNMLRLFQLVDRGVPLPFGRVRNQRSLLYVGNAAAAIEAAIRADAAGSGVFFVRDGRDVTTPELIRLIAAALRRPARLLPLPERLLRLAARGGDLLSRLGRVPLTTAALERLGGSLRIDDRLFRERTGFVPPFTLEQGLGHTAEWFRAGAGSLVVSGTQP